MKPWKRPRKTRVITGLGDVVEIVAQPIAKAIDAVANTRLAECKSCPKRKQWLNEKVPF